MGLTGDGVVGRKIGLRVEREQEVDFLLALELGGEGGRGDLLLGQWVGVDLVGHWIFESKNSS